MRKARLLLLSQGRMSWYKSLTCLSKVSHGHVHSPTEKAQIYPLSQNLRQGYKLHVTSHCKDIEQNCSMDRRVEEMKEVTRMSL